ncbi:MAG: hypothetical protein EAZ32_06230 [Cytophagia bacterium]|nr:MAG: hypothetical protein EAZ32_06230 [Cytophagia bacterium]
MAAFTFNTTTKQFDFSYTYTDSLGKVKTSNTKPRTCVGLANQVMRAQSRGIPYVTGTGTSVQQSGLPVVLFITGGPDVGYTVSVIGYGAESVVKNTAGDALREAVRLTKEYPNKEFRKAMRAKRFDILLVGPNVL